MGLEKLLLAGKVKKEGWRKRKEEVEEKEL
jgi:hypothetical protein